MARYILAVCLVCATLATMPGCLGRFAANQGRRQAARSADRYYRTYAEPELLEAYGDDPAAQEQIRQNSRQTRNDMADTIVRTGNERQTNQVGVNDRGYLTNER